VNIWAIVNGFIVFAIFNVILQNAQGIFWIYIIVHFIFTFPFGIYIIKQEYNKLKNKPSYAYLKIILPTYIVMQVPIFLVVYNAKLELSEIVIFTMIVLFLSKIVFEVLVVSKDTQSKKDIDNLIFYTELYAEAKQRYTKDDSYSILEYMKIIILQKGFYKSTKLYYLKVQNEDSYLCLSLSEVNTLSAKYKLEGYNKESIETLTLDEVLHSEVYSIDFKNRIQDII